MALPLAVALLFSGCQTVPDEPPPVAEKKHEAARIVEGHFYRVTVFCESEAAIRVVADELQRPDEPWTEEGQALFRGGICWANQRSQNIGRAHRLLDVLVGDNEMAFVVELTSRQTGEGSGYFAVVWPQHEVADPSHHGATERLKDDVGEGYCDLHPKECRSI